MKKPSVITDLTKMSEHKISNNNTGMVQPQNTCVVIIKTEWNTHIVDKLEEGAISILDQHQIGHIHTITVPGAFEIPFGIRCYWETHQHKKNKPDAFIALGAVIKGDTPHFDYVCKAVTDGVLQLNLQLPIPTIFGVLTINNQQQAVERMGGKHGHKGKEAALTAIKMIALKQSLVNDN